MYVGRSLVDFKACMIVTNLIQSHDSLVHMLLLGKDLLLFRFIQTKAKLTKSSFLKQTLLNYYHDHPVFKLQNFQLFFL